MKKKQTQILILLGWILLGTLLRLHHLAAKPPWSDEWATLVFSLGHSFRTVPLNQIIDLDTLLAPLQLDSTTQVKNAIDNLLTESTHPPIYFALNHWWLKLFPGDDGFVSIWWGRVFSSLFGILAIPAIFAVSWLWFRSLIAAQMAAALMAISPYGIYLSQEARHYTLAILLILASLSCLLVAIRHLKQQQKLPLAIIFSWIVVNNVGVGTHYFFGLTLVAEIMVLLGFWLNSLWRDKKQLWTINWLRIYSAILGTLVGCSVWLSLWRTIPNNQLTSWVFNGNPLAEFYAPIQRLLVWLITMVMLLPVEGVSDTIAIISGVIILSFIIWSIPHWIKGYKQVINSSPFHLEFKILSRFLFSAFVFILAIVYIFGADLTLSARFQFVYYPAILLLLGVILSIVWQQPAGKKFIYLTLILGICGALTVSNNWAFQKVERPDLVVPDIIAAQTANESQNPVIIATLHHTHGQTGEMMSLGWQFQQLRQANKLNFEPNFLLVHNDITDENIAIDQLHLILNTIPRPAQLWLINFAAIDNLDEQHCVSEDNQRRKATGYRYKLYKCLMTSN